jgi:hypothetical protein
LFDFISEFHNIFFILLFGELVLLQQAGADVLLEDGDVGFKARYNHATGCFFSTVLFAFESS